MGSRDTPLYSNGAFMFDLTVMILIQTIHLKWLLQTTGQGKIRFNPNLYSVVKYVYLRSVHGEEAVKNWDPKLSTLLNCLPQPKVLQ